MKWTLSFCLALLALVSSNAATIKQGFTIHEGPFTNKGPLRISTNGTSTAPGFAFPSHAGDPSSLTDGDVWYNSSSGKFRAREGGSTKDVISVGGGGGSGIGAVSTNILWVSTAGNDATAVKGDPTRPFATISMAASNVANNSEVWIMPGVYTEKATLSNHAWTNVQTRIRDKTNVVFRGFGNPEIVVTNQGVAFAFLACSNLVWDGIMVTGYKTSNTVAHLNNLFWYTYGTNSHFTVQNSTFRNTEGFAIAFGGEDTTYTDFVTVRNCRFIGCGATNWSGYGYVEGGACQLAGSHNVFSGNFLTECSRGVETWGSTRNIRNTLIEGNTFYNNWDQQVMSFAAGVHTGLRIVNNHFEDGPKSWGDNGAASRTEIYVLSAPGVVVNGNTFTNIYGNAIQVGSSSTSAFTVSGANIINNTILSADSGIYTTSTGQWGLENSVVANNLLVNVTNRALIVSGRNNVIKHNTLINCSRFTGSGTSGSGPIELRAWSGTCSNNVIEGNRITSYLGSTVTNFYGIWAYTDATNNFAYNNDIQFAAYQKIFDPGGAFSVIHWRDTNGYVKLAPDGTVLADRTNPPTASLHVHGSVSLPATYFQSGTVSNGGGIYADKGNLFVNTLTANTNYTVYNIADGQAIELWSTNSTFTETFTQFPASLWLSGSVEPATQNSVNRWIITRTGSRTNIQHFGVELTPTAGSQIGFTTNGTTLTFGVTNRITLLASNTTTATLDFSGTTDTYEIMTMGNTNVVLSPTNLISGRSLRILLTANNNNYDTVFTNTAQTAVRWAMSNPTNGSTAFTVTNGTRAEVSLLVRSNEIWAVYAYFR